MILLACDPRPILTVVCMPCLRNNAAAASPRRRAALGSLMDAHLYV